MNRIPNFFKNWLTKVMRKSESSKPRILLLADTPNWAFDHSAQQLYQHLAADFNFEIKYVAKRPNIDATKYDLIFVYWWGETYYQKYKFHSEQIIKFVSSHRWEDPPVGPYTPLQMSQRYLRDAASVACASPRLFRLINNAHPHVFLTQEGYNRKQFMYSSPREGPLHIGWAGNIKDPVKGFADILIPSQKGKYHIEVAGGDLSHKEMNQFYNKMDLIVVASRHESMPLPLIEGMASGCFPVCVDVGIVPELIVDGDNGLIVKERTPDAFYQAFEWCSANLDYVRKMGKHNSELMKTKRNWEQFLPNFRTLFVSTLVRQYKPKFRNDDVGYDTNLDNFRRFCAIFQKYGFRQIHGITLRGNVNSLFKYNGTPAEYEEYDSIANLDNQTIRRLSAGKLIELRQDLIEYLNDSNDELALHGLFHTDYSKMTIREQTQDIKSGLELMEKLFPSKQVRYFIAPFNRTNSSLFRVCKEFKLEVLAATGVHLEEELSRLVVKPKIWYRYHHHRFYPESTFNVYQLSLEKLEHFLSLNSYW